MSNTVTWTDRHLPCCPNPHRPSRQPPPGPESNRINALHMGSCSPSYHHRLIRQQHHQQASKGQQGHATKVTNLPHRNDNSDLQQWMNLASQFRPRTVAHKVQAELDDVLDVGRDLVGAPQDDRLERL
jgi:hypothetical protein